MKPLRLFIRSVQKEFAEERAFVNVRGQVERQATQSVDQPVAPPVVLLVRRNQQAGLWVEFGFPPNREKTTVETRVKPKVKTPARQSRPLDRVSFSQKRIRFCDTGIQRDWGKITQKTTQETTQKTTQKILAVIAVNPLFSRREIAKSLGDISENGVKYHLEKLNASGHIRHVGPDKGGYGEVLK